MLDPLSNTVEKSNSPRRKNIFGLREKLMTRWFGEIKIGHLVIEYPSGNREVFEGKLSGPQAVLKINNLRIITRLVKSGDIGLAEGYMDGDWDTPDLSSLLLLGLQNWDALSDILGQSRIISIINMFRHSRKANTRKGSRRNISAHYDLGNNFYQHWLDATMSYSSGIFDEMNGDFELAQRRKYSRIVELLGIKRGDRILEIGCGWGGFAERAAADFGCKIVGLTLSKEQATYARSRMDQAGLNDKVEIRVQDYRDVCEKFDHIVSIEMFEAVGEEYWPTYLKVIKDCLHPGGKAALQIITIDDKYFRGYRRNPDFIQRYIFPGGMLPSPEVLERAIISADLETIHVSFFGKSYAETLRRWDKAFQKSWDEISKLGFDDKFYRLWRYYLGYCEAGFEQEKINVGHFVIQPK